MASTGKRSKLGRWEYYISALGIILTLGVAAAVIYFWESVQALSHYGYLGAFLISLLGGATILAPVPMTPVVFALGGVLKPSFAPYLGPVFIGAAAGSGETLGGLAIYMTGYGGGAALISSNRRRVQAVYSWMLHWIKKRGSLTLFILSAILNPFFYPAGLMAGALRFSIWRYIIVCWVGKTIKGMTVAFAGYWGLRGLLRMLGMPI